MKCIFVLAASVANFANIVAKSCSFSTPHGVSLINNFFCLKRQVTALATFPGLFGGQRENMHRFSTVLFSQRAAAPAVRSCLAQSQLQAVAALSCVLQVIAVSGEAERRPSSFCVQVANQLHTCKCKGLFIVRIKWIITFNLNGLLHLLTLKSKNLYYTTTIF